MLKRLIDWEDRNLFKIKKFLFKRQALHKRLMYTKYLVFHGFLLLCFLLWSLCIGAGVAEGIDRLFGTEWAHNVGAVIGCAFIGLLIIAIVVGIVIGFSYCLVEYVDWVRKRVKKNRDFFWHDMEYQINLRTRVAAREAEVEADAKIEGANPHWEV